MPSVPLLRRARPTRDHTAHMLAVLVCAKFYQELAQVLRRSAAGANMGSAMCAGGQTLKACPNVANILALHLLIVIEHLCSRTHTCNTRCSMVVMLRIPLSLIHISEPTRPY